jgi:hypothetical protein
MRITLVPPADIKPLSEEEVAEAKGWNVHGTYMP